MTQYDSQATDIIGDYPLVHNKKFTQTPLFHQVFHDPLPVWCLHTWCMPLFTYVTPMWWTWTARQCRLLGRSNEARGKGKAVLLTPSTIPQLCCHLFVCTWIKVHRVHDPTLPSDAYILYICPLCMLLPCDERGQHGNVGCSVALTMREGEARRAYLLALLFRYSIAIHSCAHESTENVLEFIHVHTRTFSCTYFYSLMCVLEFIHDYTFIHSFFNSVTGARMNGNRVTEETRNTVCILPFLTLHNFALHSFNSSY